MRLQWKYTLIINVIVIIVLVAFYFFNSIHIRREMNEIHALGAEQGAFLKRIAENTILNAVVEELTTSQAFNVENINQTLLNLKQQSKDLKDVLNVQVTLGDNRVRSSLLNSEDRPNIVLSESDIGQIETDGSKIDTVDNQNATTILIKYSVPAKKLIPSQPESETALKVEDIPLDFWEMLVSKKAVSKDLALLPDTQVVTIIEEIRPEITYQNTLNKGKFDLGLWRLFIANKIYLSPDSTVAVDSGNNQWRITDTDSGHVYDLWLEGNDFWIRMAYANSGYIRVLYDVPFIGNSIHASLVKHAVFFAIVGLLLVGLIHLMTNHLILRPLARLTDIIQNAETGNFTSYLSRAYATDEISRATRNLVRMFIQLKTSHSRKIAALGQFAAGVAHEIRNPLNSIGMTAQHLKNIFSQPNVSPEDIEEAKVFLDIVDEKIQDLKLTSEQFLTLNRPQKLDLAAKNLNDLLDSVLSEFVLITDEAKVQIIRNYELNLPDILLDEMLIRQTLFNFVQNSIQAMPKGGSIYLTTTLEEIRGASFVMLEIRDTGIGIPEEHLDRIYDAYFTTKEDDGGVGLGLAISHQIITAHQGKVEVRSKIGMGTAFSITLPIKRTQQVYKQEVEEDEIL